MEQVPFPKLYNILADHFLTIMGISDALKKDKNT